MVKAIRNLCFGIITIIFIISLTLCCTYCFSSINQISIGLASGESNIKVNVELKKLEKNTNKAISGTQFYLFKDSGEQIGSIYTTDEFGKINVLLTKGDYYFQEITPSLGYTFDEKEGEKITKYYFTVNGKKDEKVVINAYNIHLDGTLLISKNVLNADSSNLTGEQLNTEFIFNVTFSDGGEYKYKINNREELSLKSGEILKLKHGETAVFDSIPTGISYNVKEESKDGYVSSSTNHQGIITENPINVVFTNIYDPEFIPNDETIKLLITKKLEGEYLITDEKKEFNFTLLIDDKEKQFTLKKDETKEFEIPVGSYYEVIEDNYYKDGYKHEIVNGSGTAYKSDIEVVVTNTYIGEAKKIISGEKTWVIDNNKKISLPDSIVVKIKNGDLIIEEKEVRKNTDGKWIYDFIVPKYDSNRNEINYTIEENVVNGFVATYEKYNIINTYISPIEVELPTIYKMINGTNIPKTKFEFMLKGKNMPMPDGSEDGSKIMSITGAGELNFGSIVFENPGTYTYTIYELNGGLKGWIYDHVLYTITIKVTESNGKFIPEISINNNKEIVNRIIFTNTYDQNLLGKNILIAGEKIWDHGENPESKRPTSVIVYVYGNGKLILQKQITAKDNWKYSFELPEYDNNGYKIVYTVDEAEIENYNKTIDGYDIINKYISKNGESTNSSITIESPKTGDNIYLWFILMIISGSLLIFILIIYFKNKKNKI